jgi:hypothetical protein
MKTATETIQTSTSELLSTEQLRAAWERMEPIHFGDPVLAHAGMKLHAIHYPYGFPVTIATNSPAVLAAAHQSWSRFTRHFETEPVRLQIGVTEGDSLICPPTPVYRVRDHLMTSIADGENFVVCDFAHGSAVVWVTRAALEHTDYFRYFFLESAVGCNISACYATSIHAACVALNENAVLLCGDSGAGKSTLSYACARAGWTYTTDDASLLVNDSSGRLVVGNCHQFRFRPTAESLFPELNGLPVMQRAGVGTPSIELPTAPADAIRISSTAQVKHVVFLKRNGPAQALVEFPIPVARLFMQQIVHCVPYRSAMKRQAIDHLLEVGAYELQYHDLNWAIDRLTQLVQENR